MVKHRRDPLSPKPVLDEYLLQEALNSKGIVLKNLQLDTFYQLLHRQHYPSLPVFVEQYYKNDENLSTTATTTLGNTERDATSVQNFPQKNPVSKKKKNVRRLPKAFLNFLADPNNDFVTITSRVEFKASSKDSTTTKLAVKLQDGHVVESVIMRHINKTASRTTLCVSSQVGCAMGCTFCATGTMGIRGNLTSGEILEQLVHAGHILVQEAQLLEVENTVPTFVRNVVFMGMGEPLNNYTNVVKACRGMIDRRRWNLAHGRVTVSTVGVTPKMRQLTKELPEVNLALSLHAPNQSMREAIVPAGKMYPITDLIEALDEHMMALSKAKHVDACSNVKDRKSASKRRRAMVEYVMLAGDTSSFECAHQLGKLCENRHLVVNLIPYNQTDVKDKLNCPSQKHLNEFQRIVASYGVFCSIRRTMGSDIAGACGQLVVGQKKLQKDNVDIGDIEDNPFYQTNLGKNEGKANKYDHSLTKRLQATSEGTRKEDDAASIDDGLEQWLKPLAFATAVATSWFAFSLTILLTKRKRG